MPQFIILFPCPVFRVLWACVIFRFYHFFSDLPLPNLCSQPPPSACPLFFSSLCVKSPHLSGSGVSKCRMDEMGLGVRGLPVPHVGAHSALRQTSPGWARCFCLSDSELFWFNGGAGPDPACVSQFSPVDFVARTNTPTLGCAATPSRSVQGQLRHFNCELLVCSRALLVGRQIHPWVFCLSCIFNFLSTGIFLSVWTRSKFLPSLKTQTQKHNS